MIEEIIKKLSDNPGAMIVRPASSKDLAMCQKDMAEIGLPAIPQGYIDFLRGVNGFAWNGIEFFSTDQVTDTETNYMLNDIVSANEDWADYSDDFKGLVLLGRADDDLFVYNTANQKYEVLDFTAHDVMDDFDTFDAMFEDVVSSRM